MNILDNKLVRKYFDTCHPLHNHFDPKVAEKCRLDLAYAVLQAMQEPIRKGDKVLVLWTGGPFEEQLANADWDVPHYQTLRLPSKFQAKKEDDDSAKPHTSQSGCCTFKPYCQCICHSLVPKPNIDSKANDPIEEKIKEICEKTYSSLTLQKCLADSIRNLVRMVRV